MKKTNIDSLPDKEVKPKRSLSERFKRVVSLYDELYYSYIVQNRSTLSRGMPRMHNQLGIDFTAAYDGDNITYFYTIDKFPHELFIDFKERIRRECRNGVRVTFLNKVAPNPIEWESPRMRSRLRILSEVGQDNEDKNVSAYNLHSNINDMVKQQWIEDSLTYLATADKTRGRALVEMSILVVISGKRGEEFDDNIKVIENYVKHIGITMNRVLYEIHDLLKYYSTFSVNFVKEVDDFIPRNVVTDEILSRFNTYDQGTLGVNGIYFGTDIYSHFPVLKKVKPKEDTAENWLVTAETGGGKSFYVKALILELLGLGYNGTIMDIEGFEYLPLANFMSHNSSVQIINMGEGDGKYFDPMEIAESTGIVDIDRDSKNMSINFTISIFKVLLGKVFNDDFWLDTVINDAVSEVYKDAGVTDDRNTWHLSRNLSLFDVYDKLKNLIDFRDDKGYNSAVKQAIAITGRYFEPDGTRSNLFKHRVIVADIVDADLVICSFGMAGKSPQSIDEIQLALMQLGAAQLSHQRSIFSKSQGKYNFKLWEEFQRWGKFPDSDKTLGVAITGGRKLGDVNIIITNVVKELLDDDRFGIFGNITSFMAGAIGDSAVRKDFCDRLSVPQMLPELDQIAAAARIHDDIKDNSGVTEASMSPYNFAFLCGLDRSKYGIVQMIIPSYIRETNLFKTGVSTEEFKG